MDLSTNKQTNNRLSFGMDVILGQSSQDVKIKQETSDAEDRLSVRSFSDESYRSRSPESSRDSFLRSSLSPSYNGHAFPAHVPHKAPDSAQQAARSDKTSLFDNEVISLAELRRQRSLLFSTDNRQRSLPALKDYRSSEEYRAVHVKS